MQFKQTEYSKKLQDPRWQKIRLLVYDRDGFTCQHCQAKDQPLNCHHKYYEDGLEPWEYPIESLITLCADCHSIETEYLYKSSKLLILALKKSGFTADHFEILAQILLDPTNIFVRPVLKEMLFDTLYSDPLATSMYENWIGYKKQIEQSLREPFDPIPNDTEL